MRIWREIMNDRLLGCVLCVALLLSFAVQIAGASRAAAATIASEPLRMICASGGGLTHRPAETETGKSCPCAELCMAGLHLQAATGPSDVAGIPIRFADRIEIAVDHGAPLAAVPPGRAYEARGPPIAPR